ncbi:hypothetical protein [Pararhodobacter sp. CCB-MM2]|uniref:hypothetical protein n=1 Tax=Pararhodobacter sp. CCB-MM2 TaxID=1786003 RepID=UPI0011119CE2|nr:hypothetical protein [Pararhodobacter sp. CCB-MM2]
MSPLSLRPALVLLSALIAASPALAEGPRLVAALSGDWDADQQFDAATITVDDEGGTVFTLYHGDAIGGLQPGITLTDVFWSGTLAGTLPSFEPRSDSSFAVLTQQTAIGRNPWHQLLTIAYRNGEYLVAGYDYDTYDRIDVDHSGSCSVNLLTGRYVLDVDPEGPTPPYRREGTGADRAFPLAQLTMDYRPEACAPAFE